MNEFLVLINPTINFFSILINIIFLSLICVNLKNDITEKNYLKIILTFLIIQIVTNIFFMFRSLYMCISIFLGDQDDNEIAEMIFPKWKVWSIYFINLLCVIIICFYKTNLDMKLLQYIFMVYFIINIINLFFIIILIIRHIALSIKNTGRNYYCCKNYYEVI